MVDRAKLSPVSSLVMVIVFFEFVSVAIIDLSGLQFSSLRYFDNIAGLSIALLCAGMGD
jgi:hypothetical protein